MILDRPPFMYNISLVLPLLFGITIFSTLTIFGQPPSSSEPDSAIVILIEHILQEELDATPIIDTTRNYTLIHRMSAPYSEVYGLDFNTHIVLSDSMSSLEANKFLTDQFKLNELGILPEPPFSFWSRAEGRYLILEQSIILQHGGQTSWGITDTSYYRREN